MPNVQLPFSAAAQLVLFSAAAWTRCIAPDLVRRLNGIDRHRQRGFVVSGTLLGLIATLLLTFVKSIAIAVGSFTHRVIYS